MRGEGKKGRSTCLWRLFGGVHFDVHIIVHTIQVNPTGMDPQPSAYLVSVLQVKSSVGTTLYVPEVVKFKITHLFSISAITIWLQNKAPKSEKTVFFSLSPSLLSFFLFLPLFSLFC